MTELQIETARLRYDNEWQVPTTNNMSGHIKSELTFRHLVVVD
jgi:hypothetical protein